MASNCKNVFTPITIRGIDFKNRIVLAPPSPNHASPDGLVTHEFVEWFRQFAAGGATVLYVGNSSIDLSESRDEERMLDLANPATVLPLSWYAEMAAAYNCHASLEINHNGKDTAWETVGHAPFAPSPIIPWTERTRAKKYGRDPIVPIEMTQQKIDETVGKYANAAFQMKRAGMDIALVHGGHANLIAQFTSPLYNRRTDGYGGSTKNRARFAVEVCQAIRERCGDDFVIEYRISADEIAEEGMHFKETLELIGYLEEAIDIVHCSAGIHSDYDMKYYRNWCQHYPMPHMYNVHYARDIKQAYPNLLVNTVGSIMNIGEAEEILSNGWSDFVAMCRPLMADPEMPKKYAENRPEDRRPCLRCDACAIRLGSGDGVGTRPRVINCAVNPYSGLTTELKNSVVPKAETKKKVGIVGGGLAGVYASMAACLRGHDVTLYEKSGRLGGNLIGAAAAPFKFDMKDYLAWFEREAAKQPAKILLNTEATPELLAKENFDALILAVGADPVTPNIPGVGKPHVHWAPDAELGLVPVGEKIVVIGAGAVGIEAAIDFAKQGKEVDLIEMLDKCSVLGNIHPTMGLAANYLMEEIDAENISVHYNTCVTEILDDAVTMSGTDGESFRIEADTVLLAIGMKPRKDLVNALRRCVPETSVYIVGDAKAAGTISTATNQGFQAGLHI
ncbi:MAG: FAD-dependent oxidoreductase [Clostridiales Family XIII bacterium]|jgi:2,4-dienoyl-CoA reductase-like NADH-dependent reductase (Old Yellow Enzyme family)/thioredoxin reductase|nr:FAD-dependent oxidoreductase [Clostridiales Family XIII bacterium]